MGNRGLGLLAGPGSAAGGVGRGSRAPSCVCERLGGSEPPGLGVSGFDCCESFRPSECLGGGWPPEPEPESRAFAAAAAAREAAVGVEDPLAGGEGPRLPLPVACLPKL